MFRVELTKATFIDVLVLLLAGWTVPQVMAAGALPNTAPSVMFEAFGTFSKPPISGTDLFRLQGEPFNISVAASAAAVPTKSGQNWAVYSPLHLTGTVKSGLLQAPTNISSFSASIELSYNADGEPFTLATPMKIVSLQVTVRADIMMPAGTMSTLFIHPFTAPVQLTPAIATLSYTDGSDTTVLGINGVLTTSVQSSGAARAEMWPRFPDNALAQVAEEPYPFYIPAPGQSSHLARS